MRRVVIYRENIRGRWEIIFMRARHVGSVVLQGWFVSFCVLRLRVSINTLSHRLRPFTDTSELNS